MREDGIKEVKDYNGVFMSEERGAQAGSVVTQSVSGNRCMPVEIQTLISKTVFGMPLYHIGKSAHGFFAIGFKARGIFSIGLISRGIFSLGLLSLGVISFGVLSLGLISVATLSLGLLAVGSIALGLFAAGAISIGLISFGALSVGCFSTGALALGKYAAVGDHAYGMIAIGQSVAEGNLYSHIGDITTADIKTVVELLDANAPTWLGWAKGIFKFFIQ
jgi:hypothetical protein